MRSAPLPGQCWPRIAAKLWPVTTYGLTAAAGAVEDPRQVEQRAGVRQDGDCMRVIDDMCWLGSKLCSAGSGQPSLTRQQASAAMSIHVGGKSQTQARFGLNFAPETLFRRTTADVGNGVRYGWPEPATPMRRAEFSRKADRCPDRPHQRQQRQAKCCGQRARARNR